jgi:hypothetical protein
MLRATFLILLTLGAIYSYAASANEACGEVKRRLEIHISESRSCKTASDCTTITLCPFGCYQPVAKSAVDGIRALATTYYNNCDDWCDYQCAAYPHLTCKEHKCVSIRGPNLGGQ